MFTFSSIARLCVCFKRWFPEIQVVNKPHKRAHGRIDYTLRVRVNSDTQPVALALIEAKSEQLKNSPNAKKAAKPNAPCYLSQRARAKHLSPFTCSNASPMPGNFAKHYSSVTAMNYARKHSAHFKMCSAQMPQPYPAEIRRKTPASSSPHIKPST